MGIRMIAVTMSLGCLMMAAPAEAGFKLFSRKSAPAVSATSPARPNVFKRAFTSTKAFVYRNSGKIMASGAAVTIAGAGVTLFGLGAQDPGTIKTGFMMMAGGAATATSMTVPVLDKLLNYAGRGR
jgi:hypothetical protein